MKPKGYTVISQWCSAQSLPHEHCLVLGCCKCRRSLNYWYGSFSCERWVAKLFKGSLWWTFHGALWTNFCLVQRAIFLLDGLRDGWILHLSTANARCWNPGITPVLKVVHIDIVWFCTALSVAHVCYPTRHIQSTSRVTEIRCTLLLGFMRRLTKSMSKTNMEVLGMHKDWFASILLSIIVTGTD